MKKPAKAARSPICSAGCYMPHLCTGKPAQCLMRARAYYPMFADLNGRRCVVIGGGRIAQRKTTALLSCGADVTVISPALTRKLAAVARRGKIRHLARRFRNSDLKDAWLVCAATDDGAVNRQVFEAARRRKVFANVVDQTPLCSFIAPAILRRGPLTIAVSTGGLSPSLAKKLKRELDGYIANRYAPMLRLLESLRGLAKKRLPKYGDRKVYFDALVYGRAFDLSRRGKQAQARRFALDALESHVKAATNGHC